MRSLASLVLRPGGVLEIHVLIIGIFILILPSGILT